MTFIEYKGGVLSHHGIDGQKWGIKHGPPYPIGSGTAHPNDQHRNYQKTDYEKMSSAELDRAIERIQKENKYRELIDIQNKQTEPPSKARLRKLEDIGWEAGKSFATGAAGEAGKQVIKGFDVASTVSDIAGTGFNKYKEHHKNKKSNNQRS